MKKTKIICALPKFSYGIQNRDYSTEYQSFYPEIKKKFNNTIYFNTLDRDISIEDMNKKFLEICLKFKPDYIFMSLANYEIYIETLVMIKKSIKTVLLNWCSDDSWRFKEHSKLYGRFFDYSITTDKNAYFKYKQNKIDAILSNWGCPNKWLNKTKNSSKCKYDITFIGSSYMGRDKIVNKLFKDGFKINCFGFGWKNKPVKSHRFSKILNNSKICINFSRSRKNVFQTKARIFEITGSGSLCITEKSKDTNKFFQNNKELVIFNNYNELKNKISYYIKNPKLRDKIALRGYERCKKNYLYSKIIKQVFDKIDQKKRKIKNIEIKYKNYQSLFYLIFLLIKFLSYFFTLVPILKNSQKIFRRISFELEWRIRSELVYSKKGWSSKLYGNI